MAAHAADFKSAQKHYIQIWVVLLVLLVISLIGPELGHRMVTLFAAFGIAVVKAYLVAKHFMHLNVEKKWVVYLLVTMLGFMLVFFGGVAPDVLNHEGHNWENISAKESVERGLKEMELHRQQGQAPGAPQH